MKALDQLKEEILEVISKSMFNNEFTKECIKMCKTFRALEDFMRGEFFEDELSFGEMLDEMFDEKFVEMFGE